MGKHLLLFALCLGSIGAMIGGLQTWQDMLTPAFLGGALVNITAHIVASLSEKPDGGGGGGLGVIGRRLVILLLVAGLAVSVACSAKTRTLAVTADRVSFTGLEAFHQRLADVCDAELLASQKCQRLFGTLAPAWAMYLQSNRAVRDGNPALIPPFLAAVTSVIREVRALITDGVLQTELVGHLDVAVAGVK